MVHLNQIYFLHSTVATFSTKNIPRPKSEPTAHKHIHTHAFNIIKFHTKLQSNMVIIEAARAN